MVALVSILDFVNKYGWRVCVLIVLFPSIFFDSHLQILITQFKFSLFYIIPYVLYIAYSIYVIIFYKNSNTRGICRYMHLPNRYEKKIKIVQYIFIFMVPFVFLYYHSYNIDNFSISIKIHNISGNNIENKKIRHNGFVSTISKDEYFTLPIINILECECRHKSKHNFSIDDRTIEIIAIDDIDIHNIKKEYSIQIQNFIEDIKINSPKNNYDFASTEKLNIDIEFFSFNRNEIYVLRDPTWNLDIYNKKYQRLMIYFNNGENIFSTSNMEIKGHLNFYHNKISEFPFGVNSFHVDVYDKYDMNKKINREAKFKIVKRIDLQDIKLPKHIKIDNGWILFFDTKKTNDIIFYTNTTIDLSRKNNISYIFKSNSISSFSVIKFGQLIFRIQSGTDKKIECRNEKNEIFKSTNPTDILEFPILQGIAHNILFEISELRDNFVKISISAINLKTNQQQKQIDYIINIENFGDLHSVPVYIGARQNAIKLKSKDKCFFKISTIEFY